MRRFVVLALGCLAINLIGPTAVMAQDPQVSVTKASTSTLSVDSPIGLLLADSAGKAVLVKHLPGLMPYTGMTRVKAMSIRDISRIPMARIDPDKLAMIQADFDALTESK